MSRREDVIELAKARVQPKLIASRFGMEPAQVHEILRYARSIGIDIPKFKRGSGRPLNINYIAAPRALMRRLGEAAAERGMTARELASAILHAVAYGELIDAVLDDKEDGANEH